jgi:hypothetical protein
MKRGLLLGAGFSYDLGMPLAAELTEVFLGIFDDRKIRQLARILSSRQPYPKDRPINGKAISEGLSRLLSYKKAKGSNYEEFLAGLQTLSGVANPTQSDRDSYNLLFVFFYGVIHDILGLYQQTSYEIVYPKNKEWFSKLENILSDQETWAFTLNHDLYAEYLAIDFNIPITYGDDEKITFPVSNKNLSQQIEFGFTERKKLLANNIGFFKEARGINLVKLHGGLSELEYRDGTVLCNLRLNRSSSKQLADDFRLCNEMAYYHR